MPVAQRGGVRPNAGRKKVTDKKVSLFIYVPESQLKALGAARAKQVAETAISKAAKTL